MMAKIGQTLTIGAKHEHNAREFAFDVSKWRGMWPDAQANVLMQRPGEKVGYPAISRDDGDSVTWTVTRYDTAIAGVGEMRIVFTRGEELLGMTPGTTIRVETAPDLIAGDTPKSDTPPWVQKVLEAATSGGADPEKIEEAVGKYMEAHPEMDPTVPAWAKAKSKPTYTAQEVGAADAQETKQAINSLSKEIGVLKGSAGGGAEKTVAVEPQTGYVKYDTGLVTSDTGGWNTGYVETEGFEKAEYYGRMNSGGAVLAFYDANKLYLQSGSVAGSPSGINWVSGTVNIPSDAAYAMVSSYGTGSGNNNGGAAYLRLFSEGGGGIAGLEAGMADLTGKVNPLKGKRFAVLGDSISSVNYTLPVWWQLIAEKYGCEFVNYGVSGSRIAVTSEEAGKSFTERYVAMDDTVDGVVVVGGTNDSWYTPIGTFDSADNTTLNGALNEMLPGLLNKYPGKPVLFFAPIQREDYTESDYPVTVADLKALDVTATIGRDRVNLAIMVKCRQYGVPCVDLYTACGINGNDANSVYFRTDDNLHPSALGMQRIAGVVAAEMVKHFMFVD